MGILFCLDDGLVGLPVAADIQPRELAFHLPDPFVDDSWTLVLDELAQDIDPIGDELGIGSGGAALHLAAVNLSGCIFAQHMFQSCFC